MANKQLTVKAIAQYPEGLELGCSPDVRRFKLTKECDQGDLYCRLVTELKTFFPDITRVNYSLYWKDAEGDLVQFSTMREFQLAIDAMSDHTLRIYVIAHFDEIEDMTETDSEKEGQSDKATKKGSKRVRFARAGRRFRRKIRRRRRRALSDPAVISREYRTGVRVLVRQLHQTGQGGCKMDNPLQGSVQLSPEVHDFIQKIHEEWHSKLSTQRPSVISKRMKMKQRSLPPGLERDHFLWLLRLMGRWHRRHAGQCHAMSGWSSGDTDADDSGGEETMLATARSRRRTHRRAKKLAKAAGGEVAHEEEQDPGQHKVAREFRQAVRVIMKEIHKDSKPMTDDKEKAILAALKPEVQSFIQKVADDWHAMLGEKKPHVVAKRMMKQKRSLPDDLQMDHYLWLCRYFRRWHARHATRCTVMSGWSSGEEEDHVTEDDEEKIEAKGKKGQSPSDSSSSDSDDARKKKKAVPKEFVRVTRILVNRLHSKKATHGDHPSRQEEATMASLSPEARGFVQSFAEEWDRKLMNKSPFLVAKRMRRKKRTLPAGLEKGHVLFLCRFLSRWHGKHAAFCGSMGAWSSAETEGETSGEEEYTSLRRRARRAALLEANTASEQEDTDCIETACKPVSKEFRVGVRQWLNRMHKKPAAGSKKKQTNPDKAKDDKEKAALSPEVQQFLQRFAEEWHRKLTSSRPGAVSQEMKAQQQSISLPSSMEGEQYSWLCCYMARWHRKHAEKCDVISEGEIAIQG